MQRVDTPRHVRLRTAAVFARMSGADRMRCALDMADEARAIALAGLRARHPELTDQEICVEWLRLLHGDAPAEHAARCSSTS